MQINLNCYVNNLSEVKNDELTFRSDKMTNTVGSHLKYELTTLQSIIKIRINAKSNASLKNDHAFLAKYSPSGYLEENPELTYLMDTHVHKNHVIDNNGMKPLSLKALLTKVQRFTIVD